MQRRTLSLLALVALLAALGCKKDSTSGAGPDKASSSSASAANGNAATAETVADFPSTDPDVWVNGAPVKLGELRGDVVLVEAWHRQ